jgi:hypothetical protein
MPHDVGPEAPHFEGIRVLEKTLEVLDMTGSCADATATAALARTARSANIIVEEFCPLCHF